MTRGVYKLTFADINDTSSYATGRQGPAGLGPDGSRRGDRMLSASQSRTAPSRNGNVRFNEDGGDDGYDNAPEPSRAKRRQSRGNILYDECGIRTDVLRPEDSNSVAGGSETTYASKRLGEIAPDDSASANGQTQASGRRGRRGPATAAGSDGQEEDFLLSNSPARRGDGPVDNWVRTSQGAQAFASDQDAVKDWQTKAREIVDSSKDLASKTNQDRYDWWYKANMNKRNLETRFKKLSAIDQGVCQPLMTQVMQLVDDQKAGGQVEDGDTQGSSREPLREGFNEKENVLGENGPSGHKDDSLMEAPDWGNERQEVSSQSSSSGQKGQPYSPGGRTIHGGQSSRPAKPTRQEHAPPGR